MSRSWRKDAARWLRRAAAALAGGAFDALVGSLGSRSITVAALALLVAGGAAWAAARASREDVSGDRVIAGMSRAKPDTREAVKRVLEAAAQEREAARLQQPSQDVTGLRRTAEKVASARR
jgi:hypothetical protein